VYGKGMFGTAALARCFVVSSCVYYAGNAWLKTHAFSTAHTSPMPVIAAKK